jgi:hypothetical protein
MDQRAGYNVPAKNNIVPANYIIADGERNVALRTEGSKMPECSDNMAGHRASDSHREPSAGCWSRSTGSRSCEQRIDPRIP